MNFVTGNYSEISSVSLASFQLVFFLLLKDWNLTLANLGSKEIFRSILDSSKESKMKTREPVGREELGTT